LPRPGCAAAAEPEYGDHRVVKLRLKRMGRAHRSFFRLSAIDERNPRNGRVIEELGWYDPHAKDRENEAKLDGERVTYWLGVGAQPSETVRDLLKRQGIAPEQK
jgi:small subunit ribosomal protein S16